MTEANLTVARAVQFAACIVLFGQFAFPYAVDPRGRLPRRFHAFAWTSVAVLALSAIAWLALEASNMSGEPLDAALLDGTWQVVLEHTFFGHVWIGRTVLFIVVLAALAAMRRRDARRWRAAGAIASMFLLASLAGAGHAAGGTGSERIAHLFVDEVHLVAAGAWLGCLVPLVSLLREASARADADTLSGASAATDRFSALGLACVGALILTGVANAMFAIHDPADLVASRYGLELLSKLTLFVLIVVLAAVNRQRVAPRLAHAPGDRVAAARALTRNACVEVALGFAIVVIVGNLGISMPPRM